MSIFDQLDQQDFINNFWQQKAVLFTQVFSNIINLVDGNELAGLACEEGVEARIIKGDKIDADWTCHHGPFKADDFKVLGDRDWTLLVQGVDQWDDEISNILKQFMFLPSWRLEDIMASYAPTGGSVGPHFDYYDVFLIQISGSREWQTGQLCDNTTALQNNSEVKLLTSFDNQQTYTVNAGDMIYIPAGIAHWGKSLSDDCVTFSVGFRAPSEKEIIVETLESMIHHFENTEETNIRFKDSPASIDHHPNKLNKAALKQLTPVLDKITPELLTQSINSAFGKLVTDPRYSPFDDEEQKAWTEDDLTQLFSQNSEISIAHSTNSRFAFSETHLFVNGEVYDSNESFSQAICDKKISKPISKQQTDILKALLNQQYITI